MRVSGNVPQFTFDHSGCFVNGFYAVSTDILPFSSGFVLFLEHMQRLMGLWWKFMGLCRPGRQYRVVEEVDDGSRKRKARGDVVQQRGPRCALGGKRGGDAPLAAEQEVESG
jgi:hypothetical protein